MIRFSKLILTTSVVIFSFMVLFSSFHIAVDLEYGEETSREDVSSAISRSPTRGSKYFHSPAGGKWVYDFSSIDPLSNSQNLSFVDGVGMLKDKRELDDFSTGTAGSTPNGWTESDASQGDFILDSSIYDLGPQSAHFSSISGGGDYGVSQIVPTTASSDLLEIVFSIRIGLITEGSTSQGFAIRLHYTGTSDGPELRLHSNGTMSFYGWDGAQNREHFGQGSTLSNEVWYEFILNVNMTSQKCDLTVDGLKEFWNMPMRATSGNTVLFLNTLTFHTGSGLDTADLHIDEIFATKNSIDTGFYRSPTISKTPLMNWQFLQVYPGQNEDLLYLSLINISNDLPFPGFNTISVPGNGRIDISSLSNSVSNFRIRVNMERDDDRRPALDLIGASWVDPLQFFDPLFPGTGLQGLEVEFIDDGMILEGTGHNSYATSGQVTTSLIDLDDARVWGQVVSIFDLPQGCNFTLEIISPTTMDRIPGTSPTYNGTLDLTFLHPVEHGGFRIKLTLRGDGTSTPTVNWLAVSTIQNTPPIIDTVSVEKSDIYRMESTNVTFRSADDTDPFVTTDMEYRTSPVGPWLRDIISGKSEDGDITSFVISPRSDDPIGAYELRFSSMDRRGVITYLQGIYLNVENRLVTAPTIAMTPLKVFTDNIIRISVIGDSMDPEDDIVRYRFHWFINGEEVDPSDPNGPAPGWVPNNVSSRESTLSPIFTKVGDNVSCKIVPTDLIDDGPAAEAWALINNSPPKGPDNQISLVVQEDTTVTIDLEGHFSDADMDDLIFSLEYSSHLLVEELSFGIYNVTPSKDLNGEYLINVTVFDGESEAKGQVSITYTPLNDAPSILPVSSMTIEQGGSIEIPIVWGDPEDPEISELVVDLPDTWGTEGKCIFDSLNSTLIIQAGNGNVGIHFFTFIVTDPQGLEDRIDFNITVENINDPIEGALILEPLSGDVFEVGDEVTFKGDVVDPDREHGQEFYYTWVLVTETIGTGRNITHVFDEPGTYTLILEVSEGTGSKSATVEITIEEKDDGGGGGGGGGGEEKSSGMDPLVIILPSIVIFIIIVIMIIFFIVSRKKKAASDETVEEIGDEEEIEEPEEEEQEEREEEAIEPPPVPEPQPDPEPEPEIMMPSGDDLLMPDDLDPVEVPQIEVPEEPKETVPEPDGSDVQYYSPSRK